MTEFIAPVLPDKRYAGYSIISGHCGVAPKVSRRRLFYIRDAYALCAVLTDPEHPVNKAAAIGADDNDLRRAALNRIRTFVFNTARRRSGSKKCILQK